MTAKEIRALRPQLKSYLKEFDDCFARKDTRAHLPRYVEGQLSEIPRKSVEPIALNAGVSVRTLQEFLSLHQWDEKRMRDRVEQIVVRDHSQGTTIGIIDETSCVKKGDKTPGVQRQYCGSIGKLENCLVTVHLGYATGSFHCLLDGDLFLPESWSEDRERCQAAGIPEEVVYRPKSEIALELYDQACANGVKFDWLTFDEWYGVKPQFLRGLDERGQNFVGEVHKHYAAWIRPPEVIPGRGQAGRGFKPRLAAGSPQPQHVEDLLQSDPALSEQAWERWRIKDGEKGPIVWEVKHTMIYPKDAQGLPGKPYHLIVARNVLDLKEIKYFISNAPPETPLETLLWVAFSRWRVERCFEDQKGEVGLDHYEGRRWLGLQRHLAITALSYLFLAKVHQGLREKKSGTHRVPGAHRHGRGDRGLVVSRSGGGALRDPGSTKNRMGATSQRPGSEKPYKTNPPKTASTRHQAH